MQLVLVAQQPGGGERGYTCGLRKCKHGVDSEGSSQINSTKGRGIDVRLYHQHRAFAPHLGKQITIEASLALKMKWRNSNAGNTGVTPKSRRQR
jgi:hypothetical protein